MKLYIIKIITFLCFIGLITSCSHDGHDHNTHSDEAPDKTDDHDDHDHEKIIHLNEAQYINAEIDTGWFELKNLTDVIYASGYTKLDPQDQADVSMPVSGTIKSIRVIEGDYVKKGKTLAKMESLEYSKMILENNSMLLERNKLLLEKAALKLDKSKLEESLAVAEAQSAYLQKEYDRQEALAKDNINARKVFEKVSADVQIEAAKIKGLREQIAHINKTIQLFGDSDAAYQKLDAAGGGQASLGSGGSKSIRITAPISGYITAINAKIGATIDAGHTMFSLVDNSKMHVDLLVYEKDLHKVKEGQIARFMLTNQSNEEIKGEIYNIGKSFANDTKSVAVHADIEKNNANLIPGMYINALIDIGNREVRALPKEAVVRAEGREFIFLWEKENLQTDNDEITFARLEVKTGARQLGYVEVTPLGVIHDGDKIAVDGAYYLQSHLQKAEGGGGHHH